MNYKLEKKDMLDNIKDVVSKGYKFGSYIKFDYIDSVEYVILTTDNKELTSNQLVTLNNKLVAFKNNNFKCSLDLDKIKNIKINKKFRDWKKYSEILILEKVAA